MKAQEVPREKILRMQVPVTGLMQARQTVLLQAPAVAEARRIRPAVLLRAALLIHLQAEHQLLRRQGEQKVLFRKKT